MKLQRLIITDFFSFGQNQVFEFNHVNNLILVKGEIDNEQASNGAGKSSLFEALFWCLTGKTIRGLRAKDVVRHGQTTVEVQLEFLCRDLAIKICRSWSDKKKDVVLSINDTVETFHDAKQGTERIFEILGITPEILSLVGFYGKKFHTFSNLSLKDRAEIVDLLAHGQKWEKGRKAAYQDAKDYESRYQSTKDQIITLDKRNDAIHVEQKNLENSLIRLKQQAEQESQVIRKTIMQAEGLLKVKLDLRDEAQKEFETTAKIKQVLQSLNIDQDRTISEIESIFETRFCQLADSEKELNILLEHLADEITTKKIKYQSLLAAAEDKRKEKGATICSKCGQALPAIVDVDKIEAEAILFDNDAKNLQAKILTLADDLKLLKEEAEKEKQQHRALTSDMHQKINAQKSAYETKIADLQRQIAKIENNLKESEFAVKEAQSAVDRAHLKLQTLDHNAEQIQVETLLKRLQKESVEVQAERIKLESTCAKYNERVELARYWTQGFKDLRFSAFEDTIKILQDSLNAFCSQQELDFDSIEVLAWRENVSGKSIPDLNIYVIRDGHRLPLDALSEGETQRVDLACFFTFSILIEKSLEFEIGFSVLDEPLAGLDSEGRQNVFNILTELADDNKQIFIIDHDANFQDLMTNVITIQKEKGISKIKAN